MLKGYHTYIITALEILLLRYIIKPIEISTTSPADWPSTEITLRYYPVHVKSMRHVFIAMIAASM